MLTFQFNTQHQLDQAVDLLWVNERVTGALKTCRMPGGQFQLELTPEAPLQGSVLEQLAPYRIENND